MAGKAKGSSTLGNVITPPSENFAQASWLASEGRTMDDRHRHGVMAFDETLAALQSFRETGQPHELLSVLRWLQILIAFHVKRPSGMRTPP